VTIPKADWIKDTVWHESHLTPGGWVHGTIRTEKGRFENEVDAPPDRLMTVRSLERVPTDGSEKVSDWSEIRWKTGNVESLEVAQERWGVLPRRAAALSRESASQHPTLKNLLLMMRSENRRPFGSRVRHF
jgi:hypothetical protein